MCVVGRFVGVGTDARGTKGAVGVAIYHGIYSGQEVSPGSCKTKTASERSQQGEDVKKVSYPYWRLLYALVHNDAHNGRDSRAPYHVSPRRSNTSLR